MIFTSSEKNLLNNKDFVQFLEASVQRAFINLSSFCHFNSILCSSLSQFSGNNCCCFTTAYLYKLQVLLLQLDSVKCHNNKAYTVFFRISPNFLDCTMNIEIILTWVKIIDWISIYVKTLEILQWDCLGIHPNLIAKGSQNCVRMMLIYTLEDPLSIRLFRNRQPPTPDRWKEPGGHFRAGEKSHNGRDWKAPLNVI